MQLAVEERGGIIVNDVRRKNEDYFDSGGYTYAEADRAPGRGKRAANGRRGGRMGSSNDNDDSPMSARRPA